MMKCKEYIFKQSSGQLREATTTERLWAFAHRLICRRCSTFAQNDATLDRVLEAYRDRLLAPPPDTEA